jgi:hypothetical protein
MSTSVENREYRLCRRTHTRAWRLFRAALSGGGAIGAEKFAAGGRLGAGISVILQSILISCASFAWNFLYRDPNGF